MEVVQFKTEPISLHIHDRFSNLDAMRERWDRLALEAKSPIYMSYDWVKAWWSFYHGGRRLRIYEFHTGNELAGIVPIYIDSLGYGPLQFRIARLVGASIPPHLLHPPVRESSLRQVFELLLNHLFSEEACDCVSLGPISETWWGRDKLLSCCQNLRRLLGQCEVVKSDVHTVFFLEDSYAEHLESLSKSERKRSKYELRLLSREFDTQFDVLSAPEKVMDEFERFEAQHSAQWRTERKPGHFGAWPHGKEFNRALVDAQGKLGRVRFFRILADGKVISNQYAFAFGDTLYWELPARVLGPEWERFSLGRTGFMTMVQTAIEEGLARVEGGFGHYDYKLRLNGREFEVGYLRFLRKNPASRFKARLYALLGRGATLAYHKIWYRRIQRKLPVRWQRPQSFRFLRFPF